MWYNNLCAKQILKKKAPNSIYFKFPWYYSMSSFMTNYSKYTFVWDEWWPGKTSSNKFCSLQGSNTSRLHQNIDLPLFQKMHDHLILLHKTNELQTYSIVPGFLTLPPKYFLSFSLVEQETLMVGRKERLVKLSRLQAICNKHQDEIW